MPVLFARWRSSAVSFTFALLAACGGGAAVGPTEPFVVTVPGDGPPPQPPQPVPPPAPPAVPVWNPNAVNLGRTPLFGAFPSDLVLFDGTLFVVDADQIEADGAWIRAYETSGATLVPSSRYADTQIRDDHLRDALGQVADVDAPIGFGFFLNDLVIVEERLGLVLVTAGGIDSAPPLSNVVAFDPQTGDVLQTLNLAFEFASTTPLLDSSGQAAAGNAFVQAGAEAMACVPAPDGLRLYVGMSNLIFGAPSYGAVKQRGTLQIYDVFPGASPPIRERPRGDLPTQTFMTGGYNPIAFSAHTSASGGVFATTHLLVTVGGTTAYDASFLLQPVTPASIEVYESANGTFEGSFELGLAGLAGTPPAVGRDAAGHLLAFAPSSVTGEIYVLRLDGLDALPVDLDGLAVLRGPGNGLDVITSQAGLPGANIGGCALSPDGRSLVVSTFGDLFAFPAPTPGELKVLRLPDDVVSGGAFGLQYVPGTATYATSSGRTLGAVVLRPNQAGRPDVFVGVGGEIESFLGAGPASVGTLTTHGLIR